MPATRKATIEPNSEPAEDKQTKRYQAEDTNCRHQERGNLEMRHKQLQLVSSLKTLTANHYLVYQLD